VPAPICIRQKHCACVLPMCPLQQIHSIYFMAVCLILGGPNLHLSKTNCAWVPAHVPTSKNPLSLFFGCVPHLGGPQFAFIINTVHACLPMCPLKKSTKSILWPRASSWGAPICICQKHCACVPAHVPTSKNPLYLFCGRGPDLWGPQFALVQNTVSVCLLMCPLPKIHYIYLWPRASSWGAPICICPKTLCLCACPCAHFQKSTISLLWPRALSWGAPICICPKHCAFVPAHVPTSKKSTISLLWRCAWASPVVFRKDSSVVCQNCCARVPGC
jgi:hypothetical protein